MNGAELVLYCIIGWCLLLNPEASPHNDSDESKRNRSDSTVSEDSASLFSFEPIDGFKVVFDEKELSFHYDPIGKTANSVEARGKDEKSKRRNIMKKIGRFLMMIPVGFQLLQIPFAIASVKMSLIRSILVAKVALFMLLIRVLFTPKPQEKIVIVKPPKEYHEHYYHHHPYNEPEDNKPGWFGKGPSWLY
ncbi:uncharacterized protein LOC131673045 [Phymastichus coffea]|uniref:uncharacterized protein LOC131673045 n=1 Tax=Phymastichus coffea TaxID=108790 RepID=UPI00273AE71E|nr:uncharacterized protein LOC131673045 [Phymastichus coffea]